MELSADTYGSIVERFHEAHERAYSFRLEDSPAEIVNLHLISFGRVEKPPVAELPIIKGTLEDSLKEVRNVIFEQAGSLSTKVYLRDKLPVEVEVQGPAIIEEVSSSALIHPGMRAVKDKYGNLIIDTGVSENDR